MVDLGGSRTSPEPGVVVEVVVDAVLLVASLALIAGIPLAIIYAFRKDAARKVNTPCPRCGSTRRYKKDTYTSGMGWMRQSRKAWACADCNAVLTRVTGGSPPRSVAAPPPSNLGPKNKQTKTCNYCAEEILVDARKCKHCGEFLEE